MSIEKKYAVLWAGDPSGNIGDDIQALAAIEFLKIHNIHTYELVNREDLQSYDGDVIHCIMNGWFLHNTHKFPPSDKIIPVFIGFHCANISIIENNIEYFKKYEPIGCRDNYTVECFKKHNIQAYYTGCLTVLFPKSNEQRIFTITTDTTVLIKQKYSIDIFIEHNCLKRSDIIVNNKDERLKIAQEILNLYKRAKHVITSRLHCAIPCHALGTPVAFFHEKYTTDPRFTGNEDILNGVLSSSEAKYIPCEDALQKRINFFRNYTL